MRAPVHLSELRTRTEAREFLRRAFDEQLLASITTRTDPNVETPGDTNARNAFRVLLHPEDQRTFFCSIVRDSRYWPRIKTLIGNPPYSFLLPEDMDLLRAGGICRNRSNLASTTSSVSQSCDFGQTGHFHDAHGRTYRVVANPSSKEQLPWRGLVADSHLVLDVRLKTHSRKSRLEILRGQVASAMAGLAFPRPGDELRLQLADALHDVSSDRNYTSHSPVRIKVVKAVQKSSMSPIARLLVNVLSV